MSQRRFINSRIQDHWFHTIESPRRAEPSSTNMQPMKPHSLKLILRDMDTDLRISKFGGQPWWSGAPQWPTSKATGEQMMFVGQLLHPDGNRLFRFFITDDRKGDLRTFDPGCGESAVVVDGELLKNGYIERATGPSLERTKSSLLGLKTSIIPAYYAIELLDDMKGHRPYRDKIGGHPDWVNSGFEQYDNWELLFQLQTGAQIEYTLGDCGVLYALRNNENQAILVWQS